MFHLLLLVYVMILDIFIFEKSPQMMMKNKLCGSASSARQGLSNPTLSIYLFIRHTPSYEYYVPGSPQHAIKVRVKNKADRENRIKVHSVSVLNSRNKEKVRIKTVVYTFMV